MPPTDTDVPAWTTNFLGLQLCRATDDQRAFYERWRAQYEAGTALPLGDNVSYVLLYLFDTIISFVQEPDLPVLLAVFDRVEADYGEVPYRRARHYNRDRCIRLKDQLHVWRRDAHLQVGDFDEAWGYVLTGWTFQFELHLRFGEILTLKRATSTPYFTGAELIEVIDKYTKYYNHPSYTDFATEHKGEFEAEVTNYLSAFRDEHGTDLVIHHFDRFDFANLEDRFEELAAEFDERDTEIFGDPAQLLASAIEFRDTESSSKSHLQPFHHFLNLFQEVVWDAFSWEGRRAHEHVRRVSYRVLPDITKRALWCKGRRLLRDCENTMRERLEVPRIGEGWVSETALYQALKEAFPNEEVVHHGRPAWLGRQHLDIYFPHLNVAVEYQGAQHERPVDFFGGEAAFEVQRARDRRKRELCQRHGCALLYAYENYDPEAIAAQVRAASHSSRS